MSVRRTSFPEFVPLAVALALGVALPSSAGAQEGRTFTACYVPDVGAVYLIQEEGLPSACLAASHVEFSWTDGAGVTDHGALAGLADDDHPQYLLTDGVRNATDGFAVTGATDSGVIPEDGSGVRLMWYPGEAAFRAGQVGRFSDGTEWDEENVGRHSVAFGTDSEASGSISTAVGFNTTASALASTAMGRSTTASGNHSTAMGRNTTASGASSTAMGASTVASGTHSTAMGSLATASGHTSTAIGIRTTASGNGAIAMGSDAVARDLRTFVWADGSTTDDFASTGENQFLIRAAGGVGIGTNSPDEPLSFEGVIGPKINLFDGNGIYGFGMAPAELQIGTFDATKHISLGHYSGSSKSFVELVRIEGDGDVGIGTSSPGFTLHVDGDAGKPGGGSWSSASDRRLKVVGDRYRRGLEAVTRIQPVHYRYRDDNPLDLPVSPEYVGLVAQEVQKVIPEAVERDEGGYLYLDNDPVLWAMLNAIKQLDEKVAPTASLLTRLREQEARILEQREQLERQRTRLERQRTRLERQRARLETLEERLKALGEHLDRNTEQERQRG